MPHGEPKLSQFEQLPTEIVQVIFIYSYNISLPMASPVFSQQLSAEDIYVRCATELLFRERDSEPSYSDAAVSRMLQCKWMSWRIFKMAVEECHCRTNRRIRDEKGLSNEEETGFVPHIIPYLDPSFDDPGPRFYLHLNSAVQLPEKVLRGPWTADTTAFLTYLICSKVSIDWELSSRGEVATAGLDSAITARNRTAVVCLLTQTAGVVPTVAHLKSAVMDHGCDQTIVVHIVLAALSAQIRGKWRGHSLTDVNFRDAALWSWASRVKRLGGEQGRKAEWLTMVLRYAADAVVSNGRFDEVAYDDFMRVCGRDEDEIEALAVPGLYECSDDEA